MEVALQSTPFFQGVEYLAIFCCGLVGGLAAIRKQYDVFAIIITAWLTALGGGIIRDILLGAVPPVGISDKGSVLTALIAGCVVAVIHVEVGRLRRTMLILDALALGLFAVNGTSKALMYNTSGLTAVFLGTFTAMGGGLIRDILLNEVPVVIRDRHWYIMPAVIGSVLTVVVWRWRAHAAISMRMGIMLDVGIVVLVLVLRLCSVKFNWQLPGAVERSQAHLPHRIVLKRHVRHHDGPDTIQHTQAPSATAPGAPGSVRKADSGGEADHRRSV